MLTSATNRGLKTGKKNRPEVEKEERAERLNGLCTKGSGMKKERHA